MTFGSNWPRGLTGIILQILTNYKYKLIDVQAVSVQKFSNERNVLITCSMCR